MKDGEFEFVDENALARVDEGVALLPNRGNLIMTGYDIAWLAEASCERSMFSGSDLVLSVPRIKIGDVPFPGVSGWLERDFSSGLPGLPSGGMDLLGRGEPSEAKIRNGFVRKGDEIRKSFIKLKEEEDDRLRKEKESINETIRNLRQDILSLKAKMRDDVVDEENSCGIDISEIDARWRRTIAERESQGGYSENDRLRDMESWQNEIIATRNSCSERVNRIVNDGSDEVRIAYESIESCLDAVHNAQKRHDRIVGDGSEEMERAIDANDDALMNALHGANYGRYGSELNDIVRFLAGIGRYDAVAGRRYGDGYDGDRMMRAFYNAAASPIRIGSASVFLSRGRYLVGRDDYGVLYVSDGSLEMASRDGIRKYTASDSKINIKIGTRETAGRIVSVSAIVEETGNGRTLDEDPDSPTYGSWTLSREIGRYSFVSFSKSATPCDDIVKLIDAEDDRFNKAVSDENDRHDEAVEEIEKSYADAVADAKKAYEEAKEDADDEYDDAVRRINAAHVGACRTLCEEYNTTVAVNGRDGSSISYAISQKESERMEDVLRAGNEMSRKKRSAEDAMIAAREMASEDRTSAFDDENAAHAYAISALSDDHSKRVTDLKDKASKRRRKIYDDADDARLRAENDAASARDEALVRARAELDAARERYRDEGEPTDPDNPAWKAWQKAQQKYYDAGLACEKVRLNAFANALIEWFNAISRAEDLDLGAREVWSAEVDNEFGSGSGGKWWTTGVPRVIALFVEYAIETAVEADFPDYKEIDSREEKEYLENEDAGWRPFAT